MSEKKTLLQSALDELADGFEELCNVWEADDNDGFVDREQILDTTNNVLVILRTLHSSDLANGAETVLNKMRDLKDDMKILAWSAVYIHLEQFIDELERSQK